MLRKIIHNKIFNTAISVVGTLKTVYPRIQALSKDEWQNAPPHASSK
jgi:hypothetical protein